MSKENSKLEPLEFEIHSTFNANCFYTKAGQIIHTAFVKATDTQPARAFFDDVCRGIDGVIDLSDGEESCIERNGFIELNRIVSSKYLNGHYRHVGYRRLEHCIANPPLTSEEQDQENEAIKRVSPEDYQRRMFSDYEYQVRNIVVMIDYYATKGPIEKMAEKVAQLMEIVDK